MSKFVFPFLGYDCPPLDKLYDFISTIAGGSVSGAKALVSGTVDTAVNFFGGWHHAQRDSASGFCYVNDCIKSFIVQQLNPRKIIKIICLKVFLPFWNWKRNSSVFCILILIFTMVSQVKK